MKNKFNFTITFVLLHIFLLATCTANAQTINSAEALKEYLDKQPANSPDKPIRVTMSANVPMLKNIATAINSAGKYVSLNLSGNALTSIPDESFAKCDLLAAITLPNSVISIRTWAFDGCTGLTSIIIPNSVTSIGNQAFRDCTSLTSVTLPDSVTNIGQFAFSYCTSLKSVTIPNNVTNIGHGAFEHCSSLTSITIPNKRKMTHFTQLQG